MTARFAVADSTSLLVIAARSSVGNISWSSSSLRGELSCEVGADGLDLSVSPSASIRVPLESLTSGNAAYDAELRRRIDVRQHPDAVIGLDRAVATAEASRYVVAGTLGFQGITRAVDGVVVVESADEERIVLSGEQSIDIRDFGIATPTVLRMRIYPDVRLKLLLEARRIDEP